MRLRSCKAAWLVSSMKWFAGGVDFVLISQGLLIPMMTILFLVEPHMNPLQEIEISEAGNSSDIDIPLNVAWL